MVSSTPAAEIAHQCEVATTRWQLGLACHQDLVVRRDGHRIGAIVRPKKSVVSCPRRAEVRIGRAVGEVSNYREVVAAADSRVPRDHDLAVGLQGHRVSTAPSHRRCPWSPHRAVPKPLSERAVDVVARDHEVARDRRPSRSCRRAAAPLPTHRRRTRRPPCPCRRSWHRARRPPPASTQFTCTLVTSALPMMPLPLTTVQTCTGLVGCVVTRTSYGTPVCAARQHRERAIAAAIGRKCRSSMIESGAPRPLTVPPTVNVGGGGSGSSSWMREHGRGLTTQRGAATGLRQREVHRLVRFAVRGIRNRVHGHRARRVVAIAKNTEICRVGVVGAGDRAAIAGGEVDRHRAGGATGARHRDRGGGVRLRLAERGRRELQCTRRRNRRRARYGDQQRCFGCQPPDPACRWLQARRPALRTPSGERGSRR